MVYGLIIFAILVILLGGYLIYRKGFNDGIESDDGVKMPVFKIYDDIKIKIKQELKMREWMKDIEKERREIEVFLYYSGNED